MEIAGARMLIVGATGSLGSGLARACVAEGAHVALAGRNRATLAALADELAAPSVVIDLEDDASIDAALVAAVDALGGLDALVLAAGVAGFGAEPAISNDDVDRLVRVNYTGPVRLIRTALGYLRPDGAIVAITAVLADSPMAGLAAYSSAKAGLSSYLTALRRERRRDRMTVLDVRPGHLDTGFETRPLAGAAPTLPPGADHTAVVAATLQALLDGRRELVLDPKTGTLTAR